MKSREKFKKALAMFLVTAMVLALLPMSGFDASGAAKKTKKITLNYSSVTMIAGNSLKLKVKKVLPEGASKAVIWKTSNSKTATVSNKGVVKAVKAGTVKITAQSKSNSKAKAVCKITVYKKTKKLQLMSEKSYVLAIGESLKLQAKVTKPEKNSEPVRWESSNAEVASVNKKGVVKAVEEGSAEITAASGDKKVTVNITVNKAEGSISANQDNVFTVTFQTGEGTAVAMQTVEKGKQAIKPDNPVRQGYAFGGWYSDSALTLSYDFASAVMQNITVYAKWNNIYTVKFNVNGGSAVAEQEVESGKMAVKPKNPEKQGYTFGGWYSDSALKKAYDFTSSVIQDITLYAKWNWIVSGTNLGGASVIGNGSSGNTSSSGNTGGDITKPDGDENKPGGDENKPGGDENKPGGDENKPGGDENKPGGDENKPGDENADPETYTVTFDTTGANAIAVQTVEKGKMAAEPDAPIRKGYTFTGWYCDKSCTSAYDFKSAVLQNIVLYAGWTQTELALVSSDTEVQTGESKEVFFYAAVKGGADSVGLYDTAGSKIADMSDDGMFASSGDDLPGDNIYSARVTFNSSDEQDYSYYAVAESGDEKNYSNNLKVSIYAPLTEEELNQIDEADKQITAFMQELNQPETAEEEQKQVEEVGALLEDLENEDLIADDSIFYDPMSNSYSFEYSCGVPGMTVIYDGEDDGQPIDLAGITEDEKTEGVSENQVGEQETPEEGSENPSGKQEIPEEGPENPSGEQGTPEEGPENPSGEQEAPEEGPENPSGEQGAPEEGPENPSGEQEAPEEGQQELAAEQDLSARIDRVEEVVDGVVNATNPIPVVTILYSRDEASPTNNIYKRWEKVVEKLKDNNVNVTIDSSVTVEDYKTAFAGKDLVLVHSHGSRYSYYSQSVLQTNSVVCLRDKATAEKDKLYANDLKRRRLVKATTYEGTFYWVCPSFFSYYYRDNQADTGKNNRINDAIVYMGMCLGFGEGSTVDYTLGTELKAAGAATVLGYHNSVYTFYNLAMAETIVDGLLNGENIGAALDAAKVKQGSNDIEWAKNNFINPGGHPAATPVLDGSETKTLISAGILDGSFEGMEAIANSEWKYAGDARVLTKLAELKPTDGSQMAIITTGIGSAQKVYQNGTEGSYIYQYFRVPNGAKSISFSYDVVSEEPMEYVGSVFDDTYTVELLDQEGMILELMAKETVNTSQWKPIGGINFEGGDNTTYHTEWKTVDFTGLEKYAGQYVAVKFTVSDLGDSIYDTAVLIDNVHLNYE